MRRVIGILGRPFGVARRAVVAAAGIVAMVLVPESGEEAAVLMGMALLAGGFIVAGLPALALLVPGGLYVAIGLGFTLRRRA